MNESRFSPPEPSFEDDVHQVVKTLLSLSLGEIYDFFVISPRDERFDKWKKDVGEALRSLQQNFGFELENLQSNEKFVTIVVQATRIAVQNHQKEKWVALKNAIIASAFQQDISEDLQLTFIRYIDELTPTHLLLLKFFIKFELDVVKLKSYPALFDFFNLNYEYSNAISREEFKMLIGDLSTRGLVRISQDIDDFDDIYAAELELREETDDSLPRIIITHIAKDFIRFISETDLSKSNLE
jgi:hypothetical protein